jgi:hypothetical protein
MPDPNVCQNCLLHPRVAKKAKAVFSLDGYDVLQVYTLCHGESG